MYTSNFPYMITQTKKGPYIVIYTPCKSLSLFPSKMNQWSKFFLIP